MIGLSGEIPLVSHSDVTSPFPPSGNGGYASNLDVHVQITSTSEHDLLNNFCFYGIFYTYISGVQLYLDLSVSLYSPKKEIDFYHVHVVIMCFYCTRSILMFTRLKYD